MPRFYSLMALKTHPQEIPTRGLLGGESACFNYVPFKRTNIDPIHNYNAEILGCEGLNGNTTGMQLDFVGQHKIKKPRKAPCSPGF